MPWDDRVAHGWIASKCKFWKKNQIVYNCFIVEWSSIQMIVFFKITANLTNNHLNTGDYSEIQMVFRHMAYGTVGAHNLVDFGF